jgi:hypothetical protein
MSWLSACATVSSEAVMGACPPLVEYSGAEQAKAAGEIENLLEGSVIAEMLADYSVMREQAELCAD